MANPARKLNAQLQNEVMFAELETSVSEGINEEYAIRVPRQIDREKKIWLYAASDDADRDIFAADLQGPVALVLGGEGKGLRLDRLHSFMVGQARPSLLLLMATATLAQRYARRVTDLPVKILDTRKTIPGLRAAQKYAVRVGGGRNHRIGLYDAVLIKENHIAAAGSIEAAVRTARETAPTLTVEVEVESLGQLDEALAEIETLTAEREERTRRQQALVEELDAAREQSRSAQQASAA